MNRLHRHFCRSAFWRKQLEERLLPWVLGDASLGSDLLEVGPGPGLATDWLRLRAERLTSIEIDEPLAASLEDRMAGTNVDVIRGDATDMPFEDDRFSAAVSFTMLHHVPSPQLQDRLLREVNRVLRPGGFFAGSDSISSRTFEWMHVFDTLVPVEPETFGARLEAAGFADVSVKAASRTFRFRARKAA
ncbi:MAG: class I SAM-dependent methyltransferase [Myxococcota bacterium]